MPPGELYVLVTLCVCVRDREKGRETGRDGGTGREKEYAYCVRISQTRTGALLPRVTRE